MPAYYRITGDDVEKAQKGPNIKFDPKVVNRSKFQDYARKQGMGEVNVHGADFKAGKEFAEKGNPLRKIKNIFAKKSLNKVGTIEKGFIGNVMNKINPNSQQNKMGRLRNQLKGSFNNMLKQQTNQENAQKKQFTSSIKKLSGQLKSLPKNVSDLNKIGKCYEPYVQKDMYSINPQYIRNPKSTNAVGANKSKKK